MFEPLNLMRMAQSLAGYAGDRLGVIARNIAQADTPGYRAMDLPSFADVYAAQSGEDGFAMRATRAGHLSGGFAAAEPLASPTEGEASADGNTVSLEKQMVKMADIRLAHDMALSVYRVSADITRAALGRR
jgi:flagellar basal-body rod protein FlgB